jgi:hypothetical protein
MTKQTITNVVKATTRLNVTEGTSDHRTLALINAIINIHGYDCLKILYNLILGDFQIIKIARNNKKTPDSLFIGLPAAISSKFPAAGPAKINELANPIKLV